LIAAESRHLRGWRQQLPLGAHEKTAARKAQSFD
jgi:hypothetical protein